MYSVITEHIEIDREQRCVRKDGIEVHLTGLEYGLLDYLSSHANRLCSRQELLDHVWGPRFQYDTGTIDVHLNALRRKMGWGRNRPVETIRGAGLIFRIQRTVRRYTIDLQTFLTEWLRSHEVEISSAGLVAQQHLTPFVNELTIEPDALRRMLDGILAALLPNAQPGILRLSTKLTMHSFSLSIDLNGTVNELRIPINRDFEES
jgi:DNA-binding winged helix-turn-helix (wHTH) protein